MTPDLDDLVGLALEQHGETGHPLAARRWRQALVNAGIGHARAPLIPAGLSPFLRLPDRAEPRTLVRARMAAEIVRAFSANSCVTRDDLDAAGFTGPEIAELFTEARRVSRVADMVV